MAKIFISYKYADDQVWQGLDSKYWAEEKEELTGVVAKAERATGRAYVNLLQEILGEENIYKGERQNESLAGKSDEYIWNALKPLVHDSTVTLVVISPGMKDRFEPESEQWMPNEIRYSLWEVQRGEKTSATNALLGVVIPDSSGGYGYIYSKSTCQHCAQINLINKQGNPYLFNILKGNIFNRKSDDGTDCPGGACGTKTYNEGHSYMHIVTLKQFLSDPQAAIDKSLEIRANASNYNIEKTVRD